VVGDPVTKYATTPDGLAITYQVLGEGAPDLVFMPNWWSHVEAQWEDPVTARVLRRLASFSLLLLFDARGIGLSDPA
jgi:pimeloyl-ACP methyl ester carboxylesterase